MIAWSSTMRIKNTRTAILFCAYLISSLTTAQSQAVEPRTNASALFAGQQWIGRARCHQGDVELRLSIEAVGPVQRPANQVWSHSEINARFEYGPAEKPVGIASLRGKFTEGVNLDLDDGNWISKPGNLMSFLKLNGILSRDKRTISGRTLPVIACQEFSLSSDPAVAAEMIAAGQRKAAERQNLLDAQNAKRQAEALESLKTRTHFVSVKTGEPVLCPAWQKRADENGKIRRFCNGEEVITKYYLNPRMKRYAVDGQGKSYIEAMGLKFDDLSNKMKSIDLPLSEFIWSEPVLVRDVNGYVPPVRVVLGCRTSMQYCGPTFQYADAIFLVDELHTVGMWFVNQESGKAQTCRISKKGLHCVQPENKLGESFNEIFVWPTGAANPLFSVKEQVKRSYEWVGFTENERREETARIQRMNKQFFEMIRGVVEAAHTEVEGSGNEECSFVRAPVGTGEGDAGGNITVCTRNGQGAYRPR